MNYINSNLINKLILTQSISGFELEKITIDGYIYRGDPHNFDMVRDKPTYYGDYQSALKYIKNNEYIKTFKTLNEINLLCLNNTPKNIRFIHLFFTEFLLQQPSEDKTFTIITFILLQVAYGFIFDSMKNLNLYGLSTNDIKDYLIKNINDIDVVDDFIDIITIYIKDDIIPSRCSLRKIDQLLMNNLNILFSPYNFQGIWFLSEETIKNNELCMVINRELFEIKTSMLSCVGTELCIFNPNKYLKNVRLEKYTNNKLIHVNYPNVKKEYYKFKHKYLNLKRKIKTK
jgi:hypothetical protein